PVAPPAARRDSRPAPVLGIGDERYIAQPEEAGAALSSDFDPFFALGERTGARRAAEPALPPVEEPFIAPPRPRVTPSPRHPVAAPRLFEEPRQVVHVKSLTVAPHVAALAGGDALAAERYRTLAVRLSTLAARRKIKSVVVSSADAGEGKSTVAANLAWTLARRGERRVLLLDASLNGASLNHLLGVQPARGWLAISDVPAELAGAMVRIDPNGLYVMKGRGAAEEAGAVDGTLDEALVSSRFEKLLAQLAARFDLVVIDA